jgi:periplasmic protein TonB
MRRDLLVGFIFTIGLEFLVGWGGNLTHYKPKPVVKEKEDVIQIAIPKIEPDEPEVVEDQPPTPQDIAPPMQQDVPQVVTPDSFVQQIEPPPPDLSAISKNIVKIPETRSGLSGIEVFDISKLDQQPVAKFQARPTFPFEMRRAGISGEVQVDFIVDTNGDVRNAFAAHSSQREFEAPAVQAVSKWKFKPGRKNGHAVFTHMQVPIVFTLSEDN